MAYVILDHEITNFEMLKQVYTDDAERRRRMGCIGGRIWRGVDNPDRVTVILEWDNAENARAFATSFELEQAMHWATVKAPTTSVTVYEEVHASAY